MPRTKDFNEGGILLLEHLWKLYVEVNSPVKKTQQTDKFKKTKMSIGFGIVVISIVHSICVFSMKIT